MDSIGKRMIKDAQRAVQSVSTVDVRSLLSSNEIVVLDVREPDEWEDGHIEGAILLARGRIEGLVEEMLPDKKARIVTH